jgi:hypothetical protein
MVRKTNILNLKKLKWTINGGKDRKLFFGKQIQQIGLGFEPGNM